MAALRVNKKSLKRRYENMTRQLAELAAGTRSRPTPDEIHDLRVTVRRIQVLRKLLPNGSRTSEVSRRFGFTLKSALKSTSQLRDLDTLTETLDSHKSYLPPELLVRLGNQRSDAAARAKTAISVFTEVPAPDFEPTESGKKISRRLRKRVRSRDRTIARLLTDVLNDESKVEELHALRKEVKKMRYLLELSDGGSARLLTLTKWQESLGAIHDLDVAVGYLEKSGFDSKRGAILNLLRARRANYLRFVRD